MRKLATLFFTTVMAGLCLGADSTVTMESLLKEMIDRDAVARWPALPFVSRQTSSYDRHSKSPEQPGWFANSDYSQFIGSEKHGDRSEWIMMDAEGPGCVTRFWTGGKPAIGTVRFYLDGAAEPAIQGPLQDLLCGRSFIHKPLAVENPKESGNSWLPIPYAGRCKVTYEEINPKIPGGPPPLRWYNIEYRTYAAGTPVKSFQMADMKSAEAAIRRAQAALLKDGHRAPGERETVTTLDKPIEAGQQVTLDLPAGSAAVRQLQISLGKPDAKVMRTTVLRAEFDGTETIWCPLGDFFGSGVGLNVLESWTRTVTQDGTMTCRWVMPYQKTARLSLLNLGKETIHVTLHASVAPWKWDERTMVFHANWRQQDGIPTIPRSDWNFISVKGKGVYMGDTLSVFNPVRAWFGEGDEKIRVDSESFPSHFGTGTEDYYGFAWGLTGVTQGPWCNLVRVDDPKLSSGYTVVTRTRCLDAIPFSQSLQHDMEICHWADCKVSYAVATYWYALPGATCNRLPLPGEVVRPLCVIGTPYRLADALECEEMRIIAQAPGKSTMMQSLPLAQGQWSGGAQLLVQGRQVGDFVELLIPARRKSKLTLYATKSSDYGILRFSINGQRAGADFDAWAEQRIASGPIPLGTFEPKEGGFTLRVEVVGANPRSKGSQSSFGLDAVTVNNP